MKKIILILLSVLLATWSSAQVPQNFKYQTVVRDAGGVIIASHAVGFRISILQGSSSGTAVYVEIFSTSTNQFGLATFNIGQGSFVSGSFTTIDWSTGLYWVKVEIDPAGGTAYADAGTSQLLSVPYAFHAKTVQKLMNADPVTGDIMYFNGTQWVAVPAGLPGQFLQLQTTNLPRWSGPTFPTLTTTAVTSITNTTATSGGNITNNGGVDISERGVCWSISPNPTVADSKTSDGSGTGSFASNLTGLTPATTYYIRAYATNWTPGYGNELSFTTDGVADIDGNKYKVVTIGTQKWMKENLKTTHYRDGTPITYITAAWSSRTTEAYCWYDNDIAYKDSFGALYNSYAVTDARNLCPTGWHVPTDAEWTTLSTYLETNGYGYEGSGSDIAKSLASTSGWAASGTPGQVGNDQATNNASGFTGLPGGHRAYDGPFYVMGSYAGWWSTDTWNRSISSDVSTPDRGDCTGVLNYGFSVRCIKN